MRLMALLFRNDAFADGGQDAKWRDDRDRQVNSAGPGRARVGKSGGVGSGAASWRAFSGRLI